MDLGNGQFSGLWDFGPAALVSESALEQVGLELIAESIAGLCRGETGLAGLVAAVQGRAQVAANCKNGLHVALWTGPEPLVSAGHALGSLIATEAEWETRPAWGALQVTEDDIWAYRLMDRHDEIQRTLRTM